MSVIGVEFPERTPYMLRTQGEYMTLRKTAPHHTADGDSRFPPEAFEPMDDVTEEGIDKVRKKAAPYIEAEEWEHIDGFDGEDSKLAGNTARSV